MDQKLCCSHNTLTKKYNFASFNIVYLKEVP